MKVEKIFVVLLSGMLVMSSLTGCENQKNAQQTQSVQVENEQLNDYRGGIYRSRALADKIIEKLEYMKSNNGKIRSQTPNNFWGSEGYQDFVEEFMLSSIPQDTECLNEEFSSWESIPPHMMQVENSFTRKNSNGSFVPKYSDIDISRLAKNDYEISNVESSITCGNKIYSGKAKYKCLYDNDKDWIKSTVLTTISDAAFKGHTVPEITTDMYEYARIDKNTFAIQTGKERLLIFLEPVEDDTPITERVIKEFYYSRLTGGTRTTFIPFKLYDMGTTKESYDSELKAYNEVMRNFPFVNESGDMAVCYGRNDSIFLKESLEQIEKPEWVFEDEALEQTIIYKNGALVVTTYNKLTTKYERFIYTEQGVKDETVKEIEKLVKIEGLVGEVIIPEVAELKNYEEVTEQISTEITGTDETETSSTEDTDTTSSLKQSKKAED